MSRFKRLLMSLLLATLCTLMFIPAAFAQQAQAAQQRRESGVNMNAQIYLIVGRNQQVSDERLPQPLEPVMRELRSSLPYKNYGVATVLVTRFQDGGRVSLRWNGNAQFAPNANDQTFARTPSFNEFKVDDIRMMEDAQGQPVVRLGNLSFSTNFPIQVGTTLSASGTGAAPEIPYENKATFSIHLD